MIRACLLISILCLQACATSGAISVARDQFRHSSASEALQTLSEASVSSRDQLLLYMDRGMAAQAAGLYQESINALEQAEELIDQLDYISLSGQASSLVASDWATRYSGEYSERLWIHTFQMLNYLMIGLPQDAAVEARQATALFEEHGPLLNQDVFTRSLMALSFQAAGQHDSAGVEFRKLQQDVGIAPPDSMKKNHSEIVIFLASGFIAPKKSGDLFISNEVRIAFPYYQEASSFPPNVSITTNGNPIEPHRTDTSLTAIASHTLAERGKKLAAKQAARALTQQSIAHAISDKNELAGELSKLLFVALAQADTRSWETLPAHLSLLRLSVPAGEQSLQIQINGQDYQLDSIAQHRTLDLNLNAGERYYQLIRLGVTPE